MTASTSARGPAAGGPVRGPVRGPGHGPMATMGMPTDRPRAVGPTARRLLRRLRPERTPIVLVLVAAVVSQVFAVAGPKLLGDAVDVLFTGVVGARSAGGVGAGVDFDRLRDALLLVVAVYVAASLCAWAQAYVMAGVTQRVIFALREEVDLKLGRLPLRFYDTHPRGDVLSRVTNDIDNLSQTLQQTLTQLVTSVLSVIGVLAMMLWISPLLALVSLVSVPLSVLVTVLIAKRSQPQFARQWKWTGTLNAHVDQTYSGHDLVAVYGRREQSRRTFDDANEELFRAGFRAQFISGVIMPAMTLIGNLGYVAIAVVGGLRVASGQLSLGSVVAFVQYSRQFTMPIAQLASITNVVQSGLASAERVFEVLDEPEEEPDDVEPARPPVGESGRVRGHVVFDRISFRYLPDRPLIEDLSLQALPGQTVAVVGPTGAGKTTLVNLLMRFYELDGGRILLDGVDIRRLTRDDLRRSFGMVLQDTWLFHGTIRENIAYGAPDPTPEQVLAAARAAHVDHFVRTLPGGYDTVLDDEATNVSAGERQLLTIARAFLADPAILILDEATSSVDTRTEVLVQQAMNRLRAGRTSFVIAHRLSTIRGADVILVLDRGRVVEQGDHDTLLAADGLYAQLYRSQFPPA